MGMTDTGTNVFLDAMMEVTALPATLYLAVTRDSPDVEDDGTTLSEPSDAAYARQALGTGSSYWSSAESGITTFVNEIQFPVATEDWPAMRYWVICDALTAGDILIWGEFSQGFRILTGQRINILEDAFGVNMSPETEVVST